MSSLGVKKTIRTYSRQSKRSSYDEEPPTKRRRVELSVESTEIKSMKSGISSSPDRSPNSTRDASAHPISSPKNSPAIFSDEVAQSTPPSSSPPRANSPPVYQTRRPVFSIFKPRAKPEQLKKTPLSERNQNTQDEQKMPPKKRRLVQMQLDLVGEVRKMCKICGMEYIPSNPEDAAIHRKFHAMNVGGLDFTKVFVERLRRNQIWAGGDGSFIAVIGRRDALALRNRATDVLQLVNTELAAVPISAEALWGQIHIPISANARVQGEKTQTTILGKPAPLTGDRFKMFLYIRGYKCVGACLAERIYEAYAVLDQDDASGQPGVRSYEEQSSSVSIGSTTQAAIMGISRIWTSTSHRKQGVATALLDSARAHFLYGMTIDKEKVAFSQPTASGGQLARKWFGRSAGWHVYID